MSISASSFSFTTWRAVVPFERGAREIVRWYLEDPARQVVDEKLDALMDKLAATYGTA